MLCVGHSYQSRQIGSSVLLSRKWKGGAFGSGSNPFCVDETRSRIASAMFSSSEKYTSWPDNTIVLLELCEFRALDSVRHFHLRDEICSILQVLIVVVLFDSATRLVPAFIVYNSAPYLKSRRSKHLLARISDSIFNVLREEGDVL
jgi:hypothetical protein